MSQTLIHRTSKTGKWKTVSFSPQFPICCSLVCCTFSSIQINPYRVQPHLCRIHVHSTLYATLNQTARFQSDSEVKRSTSIYFRTFFATDLTLLCCIFFPFFAIKRIEICQQSKWKIGCNFYKTIYLCSSTTY